MHPSWFNLRLLLPCFTALALALVSVTVDASGDIVCTPSCPVKHPQQHFCDADTAFKLVVTEMSFVDDDFQKVTHYESTSIRFHAKVIRPLKGASWAEKGTEIQFYTPRWTCAIATPQEDTEYLIAGKVRDGMLTVTQCDGLAIKWSDLTSEQKAGVKDGYSRQCESCRISSAGTTKHIWSPEAEAGLESGYWSPEGCFFNPIPSTKYGGEDCETNYSVCTAGLAEDGVGCEWDQNESYQECFTRREDAWFFTERVEPAFTCQSDCKAQPTKKLRWLCAKTVTKLKKQGMC